MRITTIPIAALVVSASLVGCANQRVHSAPAGKAAACPQRLSGKSPQPTDVRVWMIPGDGLDLQALVADFNQSHPDIRVSLDRSSDDGGTRFLGAVAHHQPLPDLVDITSSYSRAAIDSGAVEPAQACIDAARYSLADFLPQYLSETQVGGTQWGLPIGVPPLVLLYNQAAFAHAGLDPHRPPATLDDLERDARALKAVGVARPIANLPLLDMDALSGVPVTDADNGHAGQPTRVTFDSSDGVRIAQFETRLQADGLLVLPPPGSAPEADLQPIATGQAAMVVTVTWNLRAIVDALAEGQAQGVSLGVGLIPTLGGPGAVDVASHDLFLSARSTPQHRAAAWTFLQWLEAPTQQARLPLTTPFFPTRRSAASDPAVTALWRRYPQLAAVWSFLTGAQWVTSPIIGPVNVLAKIFFDKQQAAVLGAAVDGTLRSAAASANLALRAYDADPLGYTLRCGNPTASGCE